MPDDMVQAVDGSLGLTDVFRQHNWTRLVRQTQLARRVSGVPSSGCAETETRVFPSLALLAAMKSKKFGLAQPATSCLDEAGRRIVLRDSGGRQAAIPVNDERMIVTVDVANYDELHNAATPYQLALARDGKLQDPSRYGGKIVIVGVRADGVFTTAADKWRVSDSSMDPREQWRYGPELHANILSNLLCGVHIVPLSPGQNLLVILLMILLGISIQMVFRGRASGAGLTFWRWKITAVQIAAFAVVLSIYFLVAFISFKEWRIIFRSCLKIHKGLSRRSIKRVMAM
jgi:CHASE2 domain-containing sensor protein